MSLLKIFEYGDGVQDSAHKFFSLRQFLNLILQALILEEEYSFS
jgi:hypothetical protein